MSEDPVNAADDLIAFPADRAAKLAAVSRRQLVYWDLRGLVGPGIRRRLRRGEVRLYTFTDLVCLYVLGKLRSQFSLQRLRRVVQHLRSRGYDEPLAELKFATRGRHEIYFQHADGSWEGDLRGDQIVFEETIRLDVIRREIRSATRRGEDDFGRIDHRRGLRASKPVFAGTRLPVQTVVNWLNNGFTTEQVIAAYPDLTEVDVQRARAYGVSA